MGIGVLGNTGKNVCIEADSAGYGSCGKSYDCSG